MTTTPNETGAGVWVQPRRPDLMQFLDALNVRPQRLRELPPADAFREHDAKLADLLDAADLALAAARRAANEYAASLPGGQTFTETLAGGDEDAIAQLVVWMPARLFARAVIAQQRAQDADARTRGYARDAVKLRAQLDRACDTIRDTIVQQWTDARDHQDRWALENGERSCDTWRAVKRLWDWVRDPDSAYLRPDVSHTLPAELALLHWEASGAITGEHAAEVPLESLTLPGAPPAQDVRPRGRTGR